MKKEKAQNGGYNRLRLRVYPFLWFIAAADEAMLKKCGVPDQDKYAGIGIAILCTAAAAGISSFYAVYSLFNQWGVSFTIAFFWSIIILNLDRFMVGSMRKQKDGSWWRELKTALPRIVLALFIAILISKPLEVKIFYNQIESGRSKYNDSLRKESVKFREQEIEKEKRQLDSTSNVLSLLEAQSQNLMKDPAYVLAKDNYDKCAEEESGIRTTIRAKTNLLVRRRNEGNIKAVALLRRQISALYAQISNLNCAAAKDSMNSCKERYLNEKQKRIEVVKAEGDSLQGVVKEKAGVKNSVEQVDSVKIAEAGKDILGQLRILNSIKKEDASIWWASILITALFFILELAPLFVKFFSPRGQYDALVATAEQRAFLEEDTALKELEKDKASRLAAVDKNIQDAAQIDENVKNEVQQKVLAAQTELAEMVIAAWKQQETELLNANPGEYIKERIKRTE